MLGILGSLMARSAFADKPAAADKPNVLLARARKEFGDPVDFDAPSPAATNPAKSGKKGARKRP